MAEELANVNKPRSKRLYSYWSVALGLLLMLALVCWKIVVPVWQVRAALRGPTIPQELIKELGGPEKAAGKLALYLEAPQWVQENEGTDRITVILACGQLGPAGASIIPDLVRAPRTIVEYAMLGHVLAELPPASRRQVADLAAALRDENVLVRHLAAVELSKPGVDAKSVLPELIRALGDEKTAVRHTTAFAIGNIGPDAVGAVPALRELARDADSFVREAAAEALEKIEAAQEKPE